MRELKEKLGLTDDEIYFIIMMMEEPAARCPACGRESFFPELGRPGFWCFPCHMQGKQVDLEQAVVTNVTNCLRQYHTQWSRGYPGLVQWWPHDGGQRPVA